MNGFISQIAAKVYEQYRDEVSSLIVIFPNRRARLFFTEALARITDKPLWQPVFSTVDEIMQDISGLSTGDNIRMVLELYKTYAKYHEESLDAFYIWGEMLLSDFDSIDKYMIDADMLFSNLWDLKEIDADKSYLTPEQKEIVSRFWKNIIGETDFSYEKQKFINIWRSLAPVYHEFKAVLKEQKQAYTGMLYREAAEMIKSDNLPVSETKGEKRHYVIAGFNALSECEKILFKHLAKRYKVNFFWDYDHYYVDNQDQEAGLFIRNNIQNFPQQVKIADSSRNFSEPKNITVVAAPSDSLQCKYVEDFIGSLENKPGKETAVVLTNEELLLPLLYSIPDSVDKINVTMGYPLRVTLEYAFVERLIELQARKRTGSDGRTFFYHSDVNGLLKHPFIMGNDAENANEISSTITQRQQIYVDSQIFSNAGDIIARIFSPVKEQSQLADYLIDVISLVSSTSGVDEIQMDDYKQRVEFLSVITEVINKVRNSLDGCGLEVSTKVFASLLRKILQNTSVPFEGEPLEGVQVMGILETRCLDFENILILSANDDNFPGNRASSSSFIPYNLRFAYGLPTPQHHEGVYAYYFYRLLQRAKNVHIVYSSKSDEKSSGEQSRYIYQLEYESPHTINKINIGLDVSQSLPEPINVWKKGEVWVGLEKFLSEPEANTDKPLIELSPTAFYNYIACPLKFYFYSVLRLRTEDELKEEVDAPMFGNILHKAMQILYTPIIGVPDPHKYIKSLIGADKVDAAVIQSIKDEYFRGDNVVERDYSGNLLLVREIVAKYINTCILPYDSASGAFTIMKLEAKLNHEINFDSEGVGRKVMFGGKADRVDKLPDGTMRIVDYKTGSERLEFKGIDALFEDSFALQNAAVIQVLLYSMMLNKTIGNDTQPALYFVRALNSKEYSPLPKDRELGCSVSSYMEYAAAFEERIKNVLSDIFDPDSAFKQCEDIKQCEWCDFKTICRR